MEFKGIRISNAILFSHQCTSTEKLVLGCIAGLTKKRGACNASDAYIAETIGVSWQAVSGAVTKGKKLGIIKRLPASTPHVRNIIIKDKEAAMNNGLLIMSDILSIEGISATQKIILAAIDDQCRKEGKCTHTNKYFAQLCNCTTETIKAAIKDLEKKRLIEKNTTGPFRHMVLAFRKTRIIEKRGLRMVI